MHSCGDIGGTEEAGHKMRSLLDGASIHSISVLSARSKFVAPRAKQAAIQGINNDFVCVQNNFTLLKLSEYESSFGTQHKQNFLNAVITLKICV